jgi:hypothetical protein
VLKSSISVTASRSNLIEIYIKDLKGPFYIFENISKNVLSRLLLKNSYVIM